jgi:ABC-2 type transport system ATP-binding protein
MSGLVVQVEDLKKSYGDFQAVKGVDLDIAQGEVFALLGPNGAGKTTIVEILEGHRLRTSGKVDVLGFDPARGERKYKSKIGIVLQETSVDRYLTVAEAIDLFRAYYSASIETDRLIDLVGLKEKGDTRISKLSGGQIRRLDMALGLAGDPELLFLDEPTTGFDPGARRTAWEVIRNLTGTGKTIFLTTHYMEEAQVLADRVAIIVAGEIVAQGTPGALGGRDVAASLIDFSVAEGVELPERFADPETTEAGRVHIETDEPLRLLHDLTGWALEERVALTRLTVSQPSLEDVYLRLTGGAESSEDISAEPAKPRRRRRRR